MGPFLLTREWLDPENRLETIDEWRSRVTADLDRSIDALVDHFSRPLFFAHPFAAVTEPTNDAAIPRARRAGRSPIRSKRRKRPGGYPSER